MPDLPQSFAKLSDALHKKAMAAVPPDYADRDLHYKYLRLDNEAAGWEEAADELDALREQWLGWIADHPGSGRISTERDILGVKEQDKN